MTSKRNLLLALPTSVTDQDTEAVFSNGHTFSDDVTTSTEKIDLSEIPSTDIIDSATRNTQPSVEVPPHILEGRYRRNPAVVSSPLLEREAEKPSEHGEEEEEDENGDGSEVSAGSTTCYDASAAEFVGELTQMTELSSMFTNGDTSDIEELTHL